MPRNEDAPPVRDDGLQLSEPRVLQEYYWIAQRVAWAIFAIVILLALLGLTGAGGLFARAQILLADGGGIDYPRISRWLANEEIVFTIPASEQSLILGETFEDTFEVTSFYPQPLLFEPVSEGYRVNFARSQSSFYEVTIFLNPRRPGVHSYAIAVGQAPMTNLRVFVLP